MKQSIIQDWAQELGLRYQGVLMAAIRGCDTAPRHDPSKILIRIFRCEVLNAHCGDPANSKSFILKADIAYTREVMQKFLDDCDHFPHHYVMHLIHAAEIVGYYHPDREKRDVWHSFYINACKKLHMREETQTELSMRLEADEKGFAAAQEIKVKSISYDTRYYGGT
jgi:hypothetical protein